MRVKGDTYLMLIRLKDDGGTVTPDPKGDEPKQPTPEEVKAARKAVIEKLGGEARTSALSTVAPDTSRRDDDEEVELDLDGVDEKTAKAIRRTLKDTGRSARTIAAFALEQARKAKALEIGLEFGLEKDEIEGIQKALSGANNPDAIDLSGREIVVKLREDGTFAPQAKAKAEPKGKKKDEVDGDNLPQVDTGRGSGANRIKALEEKIDAIDESDPNAEAELAKLYAEVQKEQRAFEARQRRRAS